MGKLCIIYRLQQGASSLFFQSLIYSLVYPRHSHHQGIGPAIHTYVVDSCNATAHVIVIIPFTSLLLLYLRSHRRVVGYRRRQHRGMQCVAFHIRTQCSPYSYPDGQSVYKAL
ncbi:hypothetical protein SODALDRAFT_30122 [Sodiomyces alkalinus F11]|uniref:Uncharacterized protein n=1 Tax=Sodiomyces alkalinus (strain CBS 110278 / VKM F-3762 / F11) TaxID=1314773 RepID=A0A3N2Q8K1_SODAK|nr:hypothetical protein SODALDRAFT_30122 [Sodiomyces alkalinus F11]ROT43082.1 hypothetical protein SODALDRAFT_30122 [Sodiomyces alkalinus F11]